MRKDGEVVTVVRRKRWSATYVRGMKRAMSADFCVYCTYCIQSTVFTYTKEVKLRGVDIFVFTSSGSLMEKHHKPSSVLNNLHVKTISDF